MIVTEHAPLNWKHTVL